jgi:hypothetical protein
MELVGRVVRLNGEMTVKKLVEMKTRRGRRERQREKKGRPGLKLDGCSRIGLEECGCKEVQNRSCEQNRMGKCRERRQG